MRKMVLFLTSVLVSGLLCAGCKVVINSNAENKTETTKSEEKKEEEKEENEDNNELPDVNLGDNEKKILGGEVLSFETNETSGEIELAQLDLDLDGTSEKISIKHKESIYGDGMPCFDIIVNGNKIELDDSMDFNGIKAFTFDKKSILLATSLDIANIEDYTKIYKYSNGKIEYAGYFQGDVENLSKDKDMVSFKNSKLTSNMGIAIFVDNAGLYVKAQYTWDGSMLTVDDVPCDVVLIEIDDEDYTKYKFVDDKEFKLTKDLKGAKDYTDLKDTSVNFKKQKYKVLKAYLGKVEGETYSSTVGLYIKGEDGIEGWLDVYGVEDSSILEGMDFAG